MARTEEQKAYFKAYYQANKEKIKATSAKRRLEKPEECKAVVEAWHAKPENKAKVKEYMKGYMQVYSQTNEAWKAKQKVYAAANVEAKRASEKLWREENTVWLAQKAANRRATILQRTPGWLTEDDHWLIGEAYELAALRTKLFGFEWHVDHDIPLQGRKVSGLHTPTNLRVIPGKDNCRKSNSFTP